MRVLLDTHTFLWFISDSPELSTTIQEVLANPDVEARLSLASIWEMAIKISLGKLRLNCDTTSQPPLEKFLSQQMQINAIGILSIGFRHVVKVATLPWHHRDPFDRLLIAQSIVEGFLLASADKAFDSYDVERIW